MQKLSLNLKLKLPNTRHGKVVFWSFYGAISLISVIFFAYHLAYAQKIIPHIRVGEYDLSNKSKTEAYDFLKQKFDLKDRKAVYYFDKSSFVFMPSDVGFSINTVETVNRAYLIGREGNFFNNLSVKLRAWVSEEKLDPSYKIDKEGLNSNIFKTCVAVDHPVHDATFSYEEETGLVLVKEENGQIINRDKFSEMLKTAFLYGQKGPEKLPVEIVQPEIKEADLLLIKPEVTAIFDSLPTFSYENSHFIVTPEDALSMLDFKNGKISISSVGLSDYVSFLAKDIDRSPKGEVFKLDGIRVVEFRPSESGFSLKQKETESLIKETLLDISKPRAATLPVETLVASTDQNKYGIKELLGEGKSKFVGSIPGRIKNITVAAGRLMGVLVPPGETFSFNKEVGEISARTGYAEAYIISQGRTVLGEGGGVCQVSTTLFRAAFYAGLPIEERFAHDYRVGYYEPPLGMDATVFEPTVDLKFKNDTPAYILVQSSWDLTEQSLTFQIFGTNDGRKVEMEGPVINSQSPAPVAVYEDDPTLPKGTTKQVDFAAGGASVTVKRKVIRGDKIIQEDTFQSNYRPWRAVYKVGTG